MADTLTFDPATEYEILETIDDFQEEIQRPEELRFFTLDDQLSDYQSKVLYGKRKITKQDEKNLRREVERYKLAYNRLISFAGEEDGYVITDQRTSVNAPWVVPIYSEFKYTAYPFADNWMPLMDQAQYRVPNYYERMLKALPRPYTTVEKTGVLISKFEKLTDEEGKKTIQAVPKYVRTRGVIHEDGSFTLQDVPITNTEDDIYAKGYYIGTRPKDIPNPLLDHPFLSSNTPSKLITDEPLLDIFPTVKVILTHGVPTTTDPYGEGMEFLKIYDVKLSQIDWATWKEKFPPVDPVMASPSVLSVSFPAVEDELGLSESVQKEYLSSWSPGIQPRLWLLKQEDGGALIAKMFLKGIGDAGNVPPEPPGEKMEQSTTESTPEACLLTDTFDSFLSSGVYRSPKWEDVSKAIDKNKRVPSGTCIPADVIVRERNALLSKGRVPFLETTPETMIKEYRTLLRQFVVPPKAEKAQQYEKFKSLPESELQKDILTILNDKSRGDEDKADAIQLLLNLLTPVEQRYYDKDGVFLICSHTLSLLRGDMEDDRDAFYDKWCAVDAGFRVCKFCGEQVNNDVLIAQDEFTSDGKPVINYEVLDSRTISTENNVSTYSSSLAELRKLFNLEKSTAEQVLYLLLQLLQILPSESVLLPIIQYTRNAEAVLRANKKIDEQKREKIEGVFGIVAGVLLLQTHIPFLIPKRTFGIKTFRMSGFPRDTDDEKETGTIDSILFVFQSFFKKFSAALKGPITKVVRAILNSPKEIKQLTVTFLKQASSVFRSQLEVAKERYTVPVELITASSFTLPLVRLDKTEFTPEERIGSEELMARCTIPKTTSIITPTILPSVVQDQLELWKSIFPSKYAQFVESQPFDVKTYSVDQKDIRKRLSIGLTKIIKSDKIDKFLKQDSIDAVSIFTLTNRILDILSQNEFDVETVAKYRSLITYLETRNESPSILRDIAKGVLYELFQVISKSQQKDVLVKAIDFALQRDVVLSMLFFTRDEAERISTAASTKEREFFKSKMRSLTDDQREIQKALIDIGMAPYIVKNEDRELFAREYNYPDPEEEYTRLAAEQDLNRPEEGYNDTRDFVEDGVRPQNVFGDELEVDHGDYGDRYVRPYDDWSNTVGDADFDEGYGT
jgi:hypothetical protein